MSPWLYAVIDVPEPSWEAASRFWSAVTGWPVSDPTRAREEFPVLTPTVGDPWVVLQAVGSAAGVHLDLGSRGLLAASTSYDAGAKPVSTSDDLVVVRSPGGFAHCHVDGDDHAMVRPTGPGAAVLDQVCLDIPGPLWDVEVAYWQRLTGRTLTEGRLPEFAGLHPEDPDGGLRLLLQRLDSDEGPVRAHLDLAVADRAAETTRHLDLGATDVAARPWWTVLRSPDGQTYCLTDRDPATGRVLARS